MASDEDDNGIYKVETVPPPDGEGDAYNAPTRVGAVPPDEVLNALKHAAATGAPMKPATLPQKPAAKAAEATVPPPAAAEVSSRPPSLADDDDDDDDDDDGGRADAGPVPFPLGSAEPSSSLASAPASLPPPASYAAPASAHGVAAQKRLIVIAALVALGILVLIRVLFH